MTLNASFSETGFATHAISGSSSSITVIMPDKVCLPAGRDDGTITVKTALGGTLYQPNMAFNDCGTVGSSVDALAILLIFLTFQQIDFTSPRRRTIAVLEYLDWLCGCGGYHLLHTSEIFELPHAAD